MELKARISYIIIASVFLLAANSIEAFSMPDYSGQWPDSIFPESLPTGNIRNVKETAYIFDHGGRKRAMSIEYILELIFDDQGFLQKEEYFRPDGSNANKIEYFYKDSQLCQKIQTYPNALYPDNEYFNVTKDGRILDVEKIFSIGNYGWRFQNTYTTEGRIILTSKFDRYWNSLLVYSRMFEYDNDGRLSANESFGMDSEILWRDEYYYDEDGNRRKIIKYNPEGEIVVTIISEYDESGNYTRREFFDKDGASYAVYSYAWQYDSYENWTEMLIGREALGTKTEYMIPESLVIRDIEYSE